MKFIPVGKKVSIKKTFVGFNVFSRRLPNKRFFEETKPSVFERNKKFHIKSNTWFNEQYNEIDDFCYKISDGITNLFENSPLEVKQFRTKPF